MKEVTAPHYAEWWKAKKTLFLAGSIAMGNAEPWQSKVVAALADVAGLMIFNPRRPDWDSSWRQDRTDKRFVEQVTWELTHLAEQADIVAFYFDPATTSPISMMELGITLARKSSSVILCCPEGFWKKGNVDITAEFFGARQVNSLAELIEEIRRQCQE
jgi:hypothetical protein